MGHCFIILAPLVGACAAFVLPDNHTAADGFSPIILARSSQPGLLRMPLNVISTQVSTSLTKRQNGVKTIGQENGNFYVINLSIGTPSQVVQLAIDTGSSDIWVNPTCSTGTEPATCALYARYNPGTSTSAVNTNVGMSIQYGIGSASGSYYTDNMILGGASITAQQFGVATSTGSLNIGLLGVGLGNGWCTNYNNIIDQLALQGLINSRAFSLDLRSIADIQGSIIFGGVDTGKYSGFLKKLPMLPGASAPDGYSRYWINMASVGITAPGQASTTVFSGTQGVFLDSGGTLSLLPLSIVAPIAAALSATSIGSGYYTVDCALLSAAGTVDFGFGTTNPVIIRVPYSEFIWQAGASYCYLGMQAVPSWYTTFVLGDTFLRSAFVVYDVDNFNLHLAPAANCGTNLVVIGSGVNAVPSSSGCPGPTSSSSMQSSSSSQMSTSTVRSSSSIIATPASSSSFKTTSIPTSTKTSSSFKTSSTLPAVKCTTDNCLRQMQNVKYKASAVSWCSKYMVSSTALPTYLSACKPTPSLVSSACRCAAT